MNQFILILILKIFTPFIYQDLNTLVVEIDGLHSTRGQLMVSIYDNKQSFPDDEDMLKQIILKDIEDTKVSLQFDSLPSGSYAVAVLHDENSDEKMNFSLVGFPAEGYCFSNNVFHKFRAPRWEEAKFDLDSGRKKIQLKMHY